MLGGSPPPRVEHPFGVGRSPSVLGFGRGPRLTDGGRVHGTAQHGVPVLGERGGALLRGCIGRPERQRVSECLVEHPRTVHGTCQFRGVQADG